MDGKKADMEAVRTWMDALNDRTPTSKQSRALNDMIRTVLSEYELKAVAGRPQVVKPVRSGAQHR